MVVGTDFTTTRSPDFSVIVVHPLSWDISRRSLVADGKRASVVSARTRLRIHGKASESEDQSDNNTHTQTYKNDIGNGKH